MVIRLPGPGVFPILPVGFDSDEDPLELPRDDLDEDWRAELCLRGASAEDADELDTIRLPWPERRPGIRPAVAPCQVSYRQVVGNVAVFKDAERWAEVNDRARAQMAREEQQRAERRATAERERQQEAERRAREQELRERRAAERREREAAGREAIRRMRARRPPLRNAALEPAPMPPPMTAPVLAAQAPAPIVAVAASPRADGAREQNPRRWFDASDLADEARALVWEVRWGRAADT